MIFSEFSPRDRDEIEALVTKVFSDSEGESEGLLIGKLVRELMISTAPEDLYGFVARDKSKIIGSIFFSRLSFESKISAFILSPVAIQTDYQGQGIGQQLINYGINHLKGNGIELVFTYGDPNFYAKVGFKHITEKVAKAPLKLTYPHGWLAQSLVKDKIEPIPGDSICVSALNRQRYW